jgi:microcystin-dependent protein
MATPFVGQIISVGFGFAPIGWFPCDGRLVPIGDYQVLYTLLGTTYGGNGTTTFGVPNLNGRVPLGAGQGKGLSTYVQGQTVGTESVTLTGSNTPSHTHSISFSATPATSVTPKSTTATPLAVGANAQDLLKGFYHNSNPTIPLMPGTISTFLGGQPHENRQQFLALSYIIAWAGVFPSQG